MVHRNFTEFEAYLFDLDGTLIDTTPDIAAAVNHVREVYQLPLLSHEFVAQGVGHGATQLLVHCFPQANEEEFIRVRNLFLDYYQSHVCVYTKPYEYADHCLNTLKKQGKKVALVTNKPIHLTTPLLDILEWTQYFDSIVGGDSFAKRKPDPMPIIKTLELLAIPPHKALFIGDTEVDAAAACAAGMQMLAIPYGRVCQEVNTGKWLDKVTIGPLTDLY